MRLNGFLEFNRILDFWDFAGSNRRQCVRDWSGILCERFGNEFRGRDEVTELVEVPKSYFDFVSGSEA